MSSQNKDEIKEKAKRRANRVWRAMAAGIDPHTVVRHKLKPNFTERKCYFDWKGEHNIKTVTVWVDKTGLVYASMHEAP